MKKAYFAGGCFWCITPTFESTNGVESVIAGYSGGKGEPTYEQVKAQMTLHRETIEITYDEAKTSYEKLLDIFVRSVDPFDGGGQFIDRGRSYTLAVYYNDQSEKSAAEKAISELEKSSGESVYISVEPFDSFYPAEEYHQDYYKKNPEAFEEEMKKSGRKI